MTPIHRLALATIVVRDYDEAIRFYVDRMGFDLIEDTVITGSKRWVVVAPTPASSNQSGFLLARANDAMQQGSVGNQTGGRVSFFLSTTDFKASYEFLVERGIRFCESPREESYGTVAVFLDLYDNRWDLIQPK